MMSRTPAAIALALALAAPLTAQNVTTYRRSPADTLRYHEVTEMTSQGGPVAGESRRESTVALTFPGGDTARAWLESLSATLKMGGQESAVPAEGVLKRPILLQLDPRGSVQAISGPTAPGYVPQSQFARFFVKLPDRPLTAGAEWADTTAARPAGPNVPVSEALLIVRYKVVRDTVAAGGRAVVIEAKGDVSSRSTMAGDKGASIETRNTSSEKGRIVFSTELGRMVSWDRTIEHVSRRSVRGAPGENARTMARNPAEHIALPGADSRAAESRTRTHTLIELVGPEQLKAAPAK